MEPRWQTVKSPLSEAIAVTLRVTSSLDQLAVSYVVGGSVASSVHGIPRSTADADVVAALRLEHVAPLVQSLADDFLHLATMFKVDVFVPPLDDVARRELARGSGLDRSYLSETARALDVEPLLERLLREA